MLSRPIVDGINLNTVLTKHLGDTRMGQLEKAVLISNDEAKVFDKATFQATPDVDALFEKICRSYFNASKGDSRGNPYGEFEALARRLAAD